MLRQAAIWAALVATLLIPVIAAAFSPYLAWREPIYILAGFAGIIGMCLLLLQPLLAGRWLPGLSPVNSRHWHRRCGLVLVVSIVIHVIGLWITSPPDVVDALLFVSATPFSTWGVTAMWAGFAAAAMGVLRQRLSLRFRVWRMGHAGLAIVTILGSVIHALLIEGTMEIMTKFALCVLVVLASLATLVRLRVWDVKQRA
ncbi:ferric reductase-like transmembrane domain-containing protein [Ruegeria conchae]|uniref:ferric reductase-like transmembrane domain-containing protein n=1 Tax=Ruegeria conchae TaxID=981384 RepID=UPI00147B9FB1|nr:ferric reductase-like transmembrane domain-containing protein [Ruegeria conchae]UWR02120.1 ferric reductase-like transmembrane domain-containing protein [Ruegeria conchae]